MAMNVTPFIGTDNFDMATFNNMISQINNGVNSEIQTLASQLGVQIDSKAKIQTGSYVGTGTYGASNPCSLTFDFVPEIVIITKNNAPYGYVQSEPSAVSLLNGQTSFVASANGSSSLTNTVSWGTTVSWYISGYVSGDSMSVAPNLQLNTSNQTYYYIAIG